MTSAVSCVCIPKRFQGDSNDSKASVIAVGVVVFRNVAPSTMTTANRQAYNSAMVMPSSVIGIGPS